MDYDSDDDGTCNTPRLPGTGKSASSGTGLPRSLAKVWYGNVGTPISAGAGLQASRLKSLSNQLCFYGSGPEVHIAQPVYQPSPVFERGSQGDAISNPLALAALPTSLLREDQSTLGDQPSEVQCLDVLRSASGAITIAVSDSRGAGRVLTLNSQYDAIQSARPSSGVTGKRRRPPSDGGHAGDRLSSSEPQNAGSDDAMQTDDVQDAVLSADTPMMDAEVKVAHEIDRSAGTTYHVNTSLSYRLPASRRMESGWSGIALSPTPGHCAIASHFGRSFALYDEGRCIREIFTQLNPTTIQYSTGQRSNHPLLVLTENNLMSVWDSRVAEQGGCVQRLQISSAPIYSCTSHASTGLLAVGGADKTVSVIDTRKWNTLAQWKKVMKYEILSLHFSGLDNSFLYVAGLDHEVTCGTWRPSKRHMNAHKLKRQGFRGDSRWVGLDRVPVDGSDTLLGVTETGHFYVVEDPRSMCIDLSVAAPDTAATDTQVAPIQS